MTLPLCTTEGGSEAAVTAGGHLVPAAHTAVPWHARALLLAPRRVLEGLDRVAASGWQERAPSLWQIELGVLRMWERMIFRSDTVGTCHGGRVRTGWRARLLSWRAFRAPFLFAEGAITPWDLSGFLASREQIIRHLLGAHHDGTQFVYDLQLLQLHGGGLEELEARVREVVEERSPRATWLKDLTVFEGYHEALLAGVRRLLAGEEELAAADASDPDISFRAYLAWCAAQPSTPAETWRAWRAGRFTLRRGIVAGGAP